MGGEGKKVGMGLSLLLGLQINGGGWGGRRPAILIIRHVMKEVPC